MATQNGHTTTTKKKTIAPPPVQPSIPPVSVDIGEAIARAESTLKDLKQMKKSMRAPRVDRRQAEGWRITGHLPDEWLEAVDKAVMKGAYRSRSAWVIDTLGRALKKVR